MCSISGSVKKKAIAFPAISCRVYGFPVIQAAKIAIGTVKEELEYHDADIEVMFACIDDETGAEIQRQLDAILDGRTV